MTKVLANNFEFTFSDEDVCNPASAIWAGESNPHNVRLWLLHDHGFTICVVWADCLQDAIDEAVDCDKLDRYLVTAADAADYGPDGDGLSYLGNAGEPFDIESLGYVEFKAPKMSLTALCGESVKAISYHV